MPWSTLRAALVGLAAGLAAGPASASDGGLRRYALVIGANDGGPERTTLRFAETDARTVAEVMTELGGVAPSDRVLVLDPDKAGLIVALGELRRKIEAAGDQRTEVVVYYSGHSDERGLLLRTQRFSYKELREALQNLDSDVRIAILDSCSSGAMVTGKGGRHVAGFLDSEANRVAGHAYLTSSAADEISQEAASLGGSYFTHALVSGLRGAADVNTDQLVTLNEAYRFAFEETLARTESSRFGAQHANFDIQLSGSGDLVMTDLRERTARLQLDADLSGRVRIRDSEERLIAELGKVAGREVALLLEPGHYRVSLEQEEQTYTGRAHVDGATPARVAFGTLTPIDRVATVARGGSSDEPSGTLTRLLDSTLPADADLGVELGVTLRDADLQGTAIGLGLTHYSGDVHGLQLAAGGNRVNGELHGVQLALGGNLAGGVATGVQSAMAVNIAGPSVGLVQVSWGMNIGDGGSGTQITGGANIAGGHLDGVQASMGANITGRDQAGAQLSFLANIVGGAMQGTQLSSGLNVAHGVAGYQGGLLNIAGNGRGTQTGVLNIAGDFDGAMIGVVNIAQSSDAPLGLLSIVGDGIHAVEVGSQGGQLASTLKLGGRHLYTSYSGLYAPGRPDALGDWQVGLAFGGRTSRGPFESDLDLGVDWLGEDAIRPSEGVGSNILAPRLRGILGLPLFDGHLAPYAGGTLSLGIALDESRRLPEELKQWDVSSDTPQLGLWLAGEVGLRLAI